LRYISVLFLTWPLEGGEGSASRPGRTLPPLKTRYPLYRRLGGPQGRSGQVGKISPPPEFDPRTVQPVDSRYTDYATRPTAVQLNIHKFVEPQSVYLRDYELFDRGIKFVSREKQEILSSQSYPDRLWVPVVLLLNEFFTGSVES